MAEVYYEEYIKKRELKDRWIRFWARLMGQKIYLYVSKDSKETDFCEIIWLSSCSRCLLLKRRNYSFRFRLTTSDGSYYLKCDSNLQRHRWIHMIHLACSGRSPELPPEHIDMKCCYHEYEPEEKGNGESIKQSYFRENNTDKTFTETSEGKETIFEEELHKTCPGEASFQKIKFSGSIQSSNENNGSMSSEVSVDREVTEMKDTPNETYKKSENHTMKEKYLCEEMSEKISDSSVNVSSRDTESPAAKQNFSLKTFTFGSFRKSMKKKSYRERNEAHMQSEENRNSISRASFEDKMKYSMDNPAFADDDGINIEEMNYTKSTYPATKVINVASCYK